MKKEISFSVTMKPVNAKSDLSSLTGKWNSEVMVELTNLSQFSRGPIVLVRPNTIPIRPSKISQGPHHSTTETGSVNDT